MTGRSVLVHAMAVCILLCAVVSVTEAYPRMDLRGNEGQWLCEVYPEPGGSFSINVILLPDDTDVLCLEYKYFAPSNVSLMSIERYAGIAYEEGNPTAAPGVYICLDGCHTSPVILYRFTYKFLERHCSYFSIVPHEDSGRFRVLTCDEPGPVYEDMYYVGIGDGVLCLCPSSDTSSWGIIKSLYD